MRFPRVQAKTIRKVAVTTAGAGAVAVVGAAVAGAIPGTEGFSEGLGTIASSAGGAIASGFQGIGSVFQNLPLLVAGGAALALLVLLK